jgi:hypothetical protein
MQFSPINASILQKSMWILEISLWNRMTTVNVHCTSKKYLKSVPSDSLVQEYKGLSLELYVGGIALVVIFSTFVKMPKKL